MTGRTTVGVVVGLVLAGSCFLGGWSLRGRRDLAVLEAERARVAQDSTRAEEARRRTLDSLAVVEREVAAEALRASQEADRLRRRAASHAAADRARDSALAHAATPVDSLPIVVAQRDEARAAYRDAVEADSVARQGARVELGRRLGLAEARWLADSVAWAGRLTNMAQRNEELALKLADKGGLDLGLFKVPKAVWEVVKLGGAAAAGYCAAGGC